jgi:hypothetical protein
MFTQCPPVGADNGCQYLLTVTDLGVSMAHDGSQPSYANNTSATHEPSTQPTDALIGVVNNSSKALPHLDLKGYITFELDGDGLCDNASGPVPAGCRTPSGSTACELARGPCSFPPPPGEPAGYREPGALDGMPAFSNGDMQNGYEGPTSWFSNRAPTLDSGTVNFSPPLAPGSSTYFSLEAAPTGLPATTYLRLSQRVGSTSGRVLYVPSGLPVQSTASLSGGSGHLTGRVAFALYAAKSCSGRAIPAGISAASAPRLASKPIRLNRGGTYYWQVSYGGDKADGASITDCGASVVVVPPAGDVGLPPNRACVSRLNARLHVGRRPARGVKVFVGGRLVGTFPGNRLHLRVRNTERITVIVSSVRNAFRRGLTSWRAFRQQSRTYRGC